MEFYQELLLTAIISILLAYLVGKLAAAGDDSDPSSPESVSDPAISAQENPAKRIDATGGSHAAGAETAAEIPGGSAESSRSEADDEIVVARSEEAAAGDPDLEIDNTEGFEVKDVRLVREVADEMLDAAGIVNVEGERGGSEAQSVAQSPEIEKEKSGIDERGGSLLHGEDEWEGIERSEVEKLFRVATAYAGSESGAGAVSGLSADSQMELYGLYKVATEGPCYEPQPLALKLSARAKWHAWQRLGNMNPEVAMEKYITLLSNSIPGWVGEKPGGCAKQDNGDDLPEEEIFGKGKPDSGTSPHSHLVFKSKRETEDTSCIEGDVASVGPKHTEQGLTKVFFLNLLSPTTVRFLSFY